MPRVRDPKRTRRKILEASYREFYRHGFQGGSINRIVEAAGITKGALFHHFAGKNELGYAVLDEPMIPAIKNWWVEPLEKGEDPLAFVDEVLNWCKQKPPPNDKCKLEGGDSGAQMGRVELGNRLSPCNPHEANCATSSSSLHG